MNGLVKLPEGDTQRMVEICALKTAHIACKGAMEEYRAPALPHNHEEVLGQIRYLGSPPPHIRFGVKRTLVRLWNIHPCVKENVCGYCLR
jgi:hypothetical protein